MKKQINLLIAVVFLLIVFGAPAIKGTRGVSAQDIQTQQWDVEIHLSADQSMYAQANEDALNQEMLSKGIVRTRTSEWLKLSGEQGFEQMRNALFHDATSQADFLGGPAELNIVLPPGTEPVTVNLEARLTAGYSWQVVADMQAASAQVGSATFQSRYRGLGAPFVQTIQLMPNANTSTTVHLVYRRSFEKDAATHARLNINLPQAMTTLDITDPAPVVPQGSSASSSTQAAITSLPLKGLPASWDWRTQGIVPAIRDQGSCGSCWAFGTVAVMESAVMKAGAASSLDLSEQFLVSCNNDGWSCNGGLTASKYHFDTLAKNQAAVGAVLESVKPYTATNGTCSIALSHAYKANSWQFVTGDEWTVATVDQIKSAIYNYGPVTAAVCAGSGWDTYTGGVFSTDETSQCGGYGNHQITLVGWDDATGSWILRNSWGTGWGEGGYMRIKWGISRVGEGTSWIQYVGSAPTATPAPIVTPTPSATPLPAPAAASLVSPNGNITPASAQTFTWNKVSDSTYYYLWINNNNTAANVFKQWYTSAQASCGATTCSVTPALSLGNGTYTWWVQTWSPAGAGLWSSPMVFTVQAPTPTPAPKPAATTLVSPNGSIASASTQAFTWNKVSDSSYYYLWVNNASGNVFKQWYTSAQASCGASTCSVTPALTLGNGTYTWWVQTWSPAGAGPWSTSMAFSMQIVTPTPAPVPGSATLVFPTGSIGALSSPTYTWNTVAGSTYYYLWVDGPAGNVIKQWYTSAQAACGNVTCMVTSSTKLAAGTYNWKVQTWSPAGAGPWSAVSTFTVATQSVPAAVTLVRPNVSAGAVSAPTYTWNKVADATYYYLWVNGPSGNIIKQWYTSAQAACGLSTCSATPAVALGAGSYTWWVQSWNPAGLGPWSSPMTFTK